LCVYFFGFVFFSSRRRHTRSKRDWSSDVCSSDLVSTVGFWRGGMDIAIVVALTMTLIVIVGSLIGMSLPFIFRKLKLDPATASAPLITSIADIVGVLIYFGIAAWFLNL